jgi:hypothetical protein
VRASTAKATALKRINWLRSAWRVRSMLFLIESILLTQEGRRVAPGKEKT